MATHELDELFGGGDGAPVPRTGLVVALTLSGLVLAFLGLLCSSAPGGLLVLAAWNVVEKEVDRVDNGYLPADQRVHVSRLRWMVYVALGLVVTLFVTQSVLLCQGYYEYWWFGTLGGRPLP